MSYPSNFRYSSELFERALLDGRSYRVEDDVNLTSTQGSVTYKLVANKRFIFRQQNYEFHTGGAEIKIFINHPSFPVTETTPFTTGVFLRQKNFTSFMSGGAYVSGFSVTKGGSITGGLQTYHRYRGQDLNKTGNQGLPDTNISISPPGTYYLQITWVATSGNPDVVGIFEIHWDEILDTASPE